MTKTVTATWNFDLEAGKNKGMILLTGINNDGTKGIGYGIWDNHGKVWLSESNLEPMPNLLLLQGMRSSIESQHNMKSEWFRTGAGFHNKQKS